MRSAFPALSLTDLQKYPQHACRMFSSQLRTAGPIDCVGSNRLVVPDIQGNWYNLLCTNKKAFSKQPSPMSTVLLSSNLWMLVATLVGYRCVRSPVFVASQSATNPKTMPCLIPRSGDS